MAQPPADERRIAIALEAYDRLGSKEQAARETGIPRTTVSRYVRDRQTAPLKLSRAFDIPSLPDDDVPTEQLVAHRKKQLAHKRQYEEAVRLIPVTVNLDGPVGIIHLGDPHLDDDGTDLDLFERHVQLALTTEGMFLANVGDTLNNWVGRLARLYAEQSTSAKQGWRIAEYYVQMMAPKLLYMLGGNHDCHDMETEALTRRGWLRCDDLRADDEVLSFNPETGASEWGRIERMVMREHDGELLRIRTNSIDLAVTPNHRILCRDRDWKRDWREWKFVEAQSLPARVAVPVSAVSSGRGVALSDDQIALAGWILTDGGIRWAGNSPQVALYQSKDGRAIQGLLDRLGLEHRYVVRERGIQQVNGRALVAPALPQQEWRLTAAASRTVLGWLPAKGRLPEWADDLDARQFGVLLDALIAGDGCWDGADPAARKVAVLHGEHGFLSSVQAAAVRNGWYARISVARGKDARLNLCRRETLQFETRPATTREAYRGRVWCLTVPLGNFMIRRNGAAHFSGNCWSGAGDPLIWMTRQAGVLYKGSGARLGLRFPNGAQIRINARHDFKGHSQWNLVHAQMKSPKFGHRDHLTVSGHRHVSGYGVQKDPSSGLVMHGLQVASYKVYDRYADESGFLDQSLGPCAVTILDPALPDTHPDQVKVYWDPEEATHVLRHKKKRA